MGFLDIFRKGETKPTQQILTKAPGFAVTQLTSNNPFTSLIEDESNYFAQNILYVSKSIDYISNKVASAEIMLEDNAGQVVENSDLWDDLQAFNPYMTLWEARKLVVMHKYLVGAAFWYIDRDPQVGKKAEFYPLDPTQVKMKTDASGLPAYYQYTDANGIMVRLEKEDVIYHRRMNPKVWFEGQSIVKEILFWTNAYAQGAQYNMNKLGNNANVDKFIYFDGISEAQREKLEYNMKNKYEGAKNAGRTGIVNSKPEVIDVSSNQKDLDYVQGMKLLRQDILAAFGIPEALFFPSATNANSKEAARSFQADTLEPLMQQEKSVFNEQLIPKYKDARSEKLVFTFAPVVDADVNELVAQAKQMVDAGVFTRDQALEYIGQEPIGGKLGAEYPKDSTIAPQNGITEDIEGLKAKTKSVGDQLNKIIEEKEEKEFRCKNNKLADDQEGIMYQAAEGLFQAQFGRAKDYIERTDDPTVRGIFNYKEEVEYTKQAFKEAYGKVMGNSNDVANTEIKEKLFKNSSPSFTAYKVKSISGDAIEAIARKVAYFSEEINDVSQKKLRKILTDAKDKGYDKTQMIAAIEDVFNGYIDGDKNIEVLKGLNLYTPSIGNTDSRYSKMLEGITTAYDAGDITLADQEKALKALRGLVDPSSPIGKQVDNLLTSLYRVNKEEGISRSRAVTIARTESTFARNLGFNDTYDDNPFIKGKTWRSLSDNDTRDSHRSMSGTTVATNEVFELPGGDVKFPGDTSLGAGAEEIVNCRCRITAEVID